MNKNNYIFSELINLQGVAKTLKYLIKIKQLKPDIKLKHIRDLDLNKLKAENKIKYIVLDKDNTIALHKSNEIPNQEMKEILNNFLNVFGKDNVAILSNTAGSANDKDYSDLILIEKNFGIKVIKHKFKKPSVDFEIFEHFKLNENLSNEKRSSVCCIGDRLFTDVIMGKEIGSFTVLIDPLDGSTDNFIVRNVRKIEKIIVDRIML
jgi:phosphatidylglycerophosphatase GEP4